MSGLRLRAFGFTAAIAILLACGATFGSRSSSASTPVSASEIAIIRLIRTVGALEARIESLETRIRLLEQDETKEPLRRRASVEPPRAAFALTDECEELTFFDARGIRRFKTHCLTDAKPGPCDPPFALDQGGIKRMNRTCSDAPRTPLLHLQ